MSDPATNVTEPPVVFAVTPEEGQMVLMLVFGQCIASLIATVFGISVFFSIRYKYPRLVNRVTFRLALATMISGFCLGVSQLFLVFRGTPTSPECIYSMWSFIFFNLTSIFFPYLYCSESTNRVHP
jgi:hypothetical protein